MNKGSQGGNAGVVISILVPSNRKCLEAMPIICRLASLSSEKIEIIVADNSGDPEKRSLLAQLQKSHRNLIVLNNQTGIPASDNYQTALSAASGRYAMLCADDDYVEPGYVANALEIIAGATEDVCITPSIFEYVGDGTLRAARMPQEEAAQNWAERILLHVAAQTSPWAMYSILPKRILEQFLGFTRLHPLSGSFSDWHFEYFTRAYCRCLNVRSGYYLYDCRRWLDPRSAVDADVRQYLRVGLPDWFVVFHQMYWAVDICNFIDSAYFPSGEEARQRIVTAMLSRRMEIFRAEILGIKRLMFAQTPISDELRGKINGLINEAKWSRGKCESVLLDLLDEISPDKKEKYRLFAEKLKTQRYVPVETEATASPAVQSPPEEQASASREGGPLFSVIITTFNRPDLLRHAIGSVESQSFRDFELILVNDAGEPVEGLLPEFSIPIKYIRQDCNQGLSAARNAGMRQARGRYLCFLDDDDLYAPKHLRTFADALPNHPPGTVLYTDAWYVGETIVDNRRIESSRTIPYAHAAYSPQRLWVANYIPVNTWCVPRELFDAVGSFDTTLPALEDWEMLLRFSQRSRLVHLAQPTVEVRVRESLQDRMSLHQRKNFPVLFRNIYARYPTQDSTVEQGRRQMLASLDAEMEGVVPANPAAQANASTPADWDEPAYLRMNPDVAAAVRSNAFPSGYAHFLAFGQFEGRLQKGSDEKRPQADPGFHPQEDATPSARLAVVLHPARAIDDEQDKIVEAEQAKVKLIAFYRPQSHLSSEDRDSGWDAISNAQPAFIGHQQPQTPALSASYDSSPNALDQQASLAREHGVSAFCYFYQTDENQSQHNRALQDMLESGRPDFPFCLCLESGERMPVTRADQDDVDLIRALVPYFSDPRQIKIGGRPALVIARPDHFPDIRRTAQLWREEMRNAGIGDLFLIALEIAEVPSPQLLGLDATCEFPPYGTNLPDDRDAVAFSRPFHGRIFDYEKLVHAALERRLQAHIMFRGITPGWDDTPQLGDRANIYANGAPDKYNYWLSELIDDANRRCPEGARAIFVNAWNDWAHGAHLEPDQAHGNAYLDATKAALQGDRWSQGEFLDKHSYAKWIAQRRLTDVQRRLFDRRIETAWPKRYEFHVALLCDGQAPASEIIRSLRSLSTQYYAEVNISVFATVAPPAGLEASMGQNWQVVPAQQLIPAANASLANSPADWVAVLRAGDTVAEYAFLSLGEALFSHPDWKAVYTDDDEQDAHGNCLNHRFKPDFNLDLARSCPRHLGDAIFVERATLAKLGGFDPQAGSLAAQDFVFRLFETSGSGTIGHLPDVLVHLHRRDVSEAVLGESLQAGARLLQRHLARCGIQASLETGLVPESYRVGYEHSQSPLVSIVIPTKDKAPVLQRCIESLLEKTRYPAYEILIVDNGSRTAEAQAYLKGLRELGDPKIKILEYPAAFNYSAMNNLAARHAAGEYLLLLNNDTAIIQESWLDTMMRHALRPEVGVVGARLSYPEGRIQHAGVVLGINGPAEHPFIGNPLDAPGYMGRALLEQDYSAVTGACLLVRKSLFDQVEGLDEVALQVSYSDIDLCLKIRRLGYLVVWTPYAVLLHEGSASQKSNVEARNKEEKLRRFESEQDEMYRRWRHLLANDPAYNPNLGLNTTQFRVSPGIEITKDPITWKPFPSVMSMPADRQGSGCYRVIHPCVFAHLTGKTRSRVVGGYFPPALYEQLEIDTLYTQRQLNDDQIALLSRFRKILDCKVVMDFDDLLSAVPHASIHKKDIYKDIRARLRKAAAIVDRITVSTAPLGEYFKDMGADVQVVPNALFPPIWENLNPLRRQSAKPRVGWAGGISHDGDLAVIADVVKALASEVEWVFMGMCPEAIRPYVAEFHPGASIDLYPRRLAELNLDLALAPVEHNAFNECKSNLRILEYGVLGYPVIATNFAPYQGDFPITLVKNRFKDWVDAIRDHIADLDETARRADLLRQVIRDRWMLDNTVDTWVDAWTRPAGSAR